MTHQYLIPHIRARIPEGRTNGIKTIIIWWQCWIGDTLRPRVRESAYTYGVSFAPPYYTGITLWGPN
jgi:hypothetical protein